MWTMIHVQSEIFFKSNDQPRGSSILVIASNFLCEQGYFYTPGWDAIAGIALQAPSCRVANHSTGFDSSCPLTEFAIIIMTTVIKTIYFLKVSYLTFAKCFLFSVTFCFLWTSFCFLSFRILCILVKREFDIDHNKNTNKKCTVWPTCTWATNLF